LLVMLDRCVSSGSVRPACLLPQPENTTQSGGGNKEKRKQQKNLYYIAVILCYSDHPLSEDQSSPCHAHTGIKPNPLSHVILMNLGKLPGLLGLYTMCSSGMFVLQIPVLPSTITDQIRLWELERDRLQFTEGEHVLFVCVHMQTHKPGGERVSGAVCSNAPK